MKIIFHRAKKHAKRHFHRRYKKPHGPRAHIILTIDGVLVSIILALLAFGSYFAFFYHPLRDAFRIEVLTAEVLRSGEPTTVTVRITNAGEESLSNIRIATYFPPEFRPVGAPHDEIEISSLPPKMSLDHEFRGLLLGPPQSTPIFVKMSAKNETGETDEKVASGQLCWKDNLIKAAWEMPETAVREQSLTFKFKLQNDADLDFERVLFRPTWPEGFRLQLSSPPLFGGQASIGPIGPDESVELAFQGLLNGKESDQLGFGGEIVWMDGEEEVLLAAASSDTVIFSSDLNLTARLADTEIAAVKPGDSVPITISYSNDGGYILKNVRFSLPLDARMVNAQLSKAVEGGQSGNQLVWSSLTFPTLSQIGPGDTGELQAELRIKKQVSVFVNNPILKLTPAAEFSIDEPRIDDARVPGVATEVKVAGTAELATVARYFTNEGDQIGRGVLPPRVDRTTRYWVVMRVQNGPTEVRNGRVRVTLPENATWTGKSAVTTGLDLEASENGRVLTWEIGSLPAHAGVVSPAPNASFEVAIEPTAAQVGTEPPLILSALFKGIDAWTEQEISSDQGALTTALSTDPFIKGRTSVLP